MTEPDTRRHVAVIGAGVVGLATAAQLAMRGVRVTVIDPNPPGEGCSYGNAACLSRASVVPLGLPGLWKKVPRYLLDPDGPFRIRGSYALAAVPWMLRLQLASRLGRVNRIADALHPLLDPCVLEWRRLAAWADVSELIRQEGHAFVYESEAAFQGDALGRALRQARGVRIEILQGAAIRAFDPALSPRITHMTWMPEQGHVTNPGRLSKALAAALRSRGADFVEAAAADFEFSASTVRGVRTAARLVEADAIVVTAGAHSKPFAAKLGHSVPLDTERGYHVMLSAGMGAPRIPTCSGEGKFFATPLETGLRIAGTVELAGLEAPPSHARAEVLCKLAKKMLPDIDETEKSWWMGHRPSLPDSLPVLGRSTRFSNAFFNFGHGHVGLTAAPVSGIAIADLITHGESRLDLRPYSPAR